MVGFEGVLVWSSKYHIGGNTMIRVKFASLLALLIALLGALCVPSKANAACTAATIANTYGFHFDGFAGPGAPTALKVSAFVPAAGIGEVTFTPTSDTEGTISGSQSLSFGGLQFQTTFTGTYTVNVPKCTGSLSAMFPDGGNPTQDFVIVHGGEEIFFLQTNPGAVSASVGKKE
jgi:hypothetical protein